MASTSVSSIQKSFKYDVFLSFRGEDTRRTFVDHLYHALHNRGITTYKDDECIEKGKRIGNQLMTAIEESRFHLIVFSKNYASSSWCLDELVKIVECQRTTEQTAYPIFYDVEPIEVRNQSGIFGEAFTKILEKEAVGRWRDALKQAAALAGWELKNTLDGHEAKFIEKIMEEILLKLYFINLSIDDNLVGMEVRVNEIVSSLEIGLDSVRMIGIKGIGGGGKTTLANAVFDHVSCWFEGVSFVENVREVSKSSLNGLKELQKKVLSDVLNDQTVVVKSVSEGKNKIKRMMVSRKVLVVLDDVDDIDQLEALAGEPNWFKPGSRIIITTRDEQVLVAHGVNFIHDVNLLTREEAMCLFSRHAFKTQIPNQGYEDLFRKVVDYAAGLPLTLKVLGSHLCGRTETEWVDAIERLKTIPLEKTLTRLEISYVGLESDQKEIFLDVACLLKGMEREIAIRVLESCGFYAEIGLRVLEQKSLLTVSDSDCLQMHDHLEEMGKNIARRSHPGEPNKHNRLWIREEIDDILVNDLGTNRTRSIKLQNSKTPLDIIMKGLRKMEELRVLFVHNGNLKDIAELVDQYLPNTLQSLYWFGYPFECLPKTFQANKLVHLEISFGNFTQLWDTGEKKVFNKLKFLVLKYLDIKSFDMGMTPNLQIFRLEECRNFVELSMPVASPKLKFLQLKSSNVSNLNIGSTPCLETLNLSHCHSLVELHMPVECPKLKILKLSGSNVSSLRIESAPCLETVDLADCNYLVELHMPVDCPNLKTLKLWGSKVSSLNIGSASSLETLILRNYSLVKLHMPVDCPKFKFLKLYGSKVSSLNIGSAPCLEKVDLENCNDLVELHMPVESLKLKSLNICGSKISSLNIGSAPCLERLNLVECNHLAELHMPFECPKLKFLKLCGTKVSSLIIGYAPCLEMLDLENCNDLAELYVPIECPKLEYLKLCDSKVSSLNIGSAPCLEMLNLANCHDLVELHMPVELPKLNVLNLCGSVVSSLNIGSALCLETLDLADCNYLVELHMPVECPKLKILNLRAPKVSSLNIGSAPCLEKLKLTVYSLVELHMPVDCPKLRFLKLYGPKVSSLNIGSAQCLEMLILVDCNDLVELHMPVECPKLKFLILRGSKASSLNIGPAPCLELLDLSDCNELVELHMPVESPKLKVLNLSCSKVSNVNLEFTPHLERLVLNNCYFLQEIYNPVGCLKNIVYLNLSGCSRFEDFRVEKGYKLKGYAKVLNLTTESLATCQLHPNSNLPKFRFKCLYDEDLPSSSGNLEKLLSFGLCACTNLDSFSESICGLQGLTELALEGSIPEVPKDLYLLESLEHLTLSMKEITHLPDSLRMLKHLKSLNLSYFQFLEQLPKDIGRLEGLEVLNLKDCISLRDIPNSICNMKSLKYINLQFCILVEKLPEEIGCLECLEEIDIEGAGIRRLPQSIFELKGLYIFGSVWQFESYGFTTTKEISTDQASWYIIL